MNHSSTAPITFDHRCGSIAHGAPASAYRRVEPSGRRVRPQLRRPNYTARRVGAVTAVVAAVLVVASALDAVVVSFGGDPAFADEAVPATQPAVATHVARPGDSLWSIADEYRGEVARDRYVRALITLNGSTTILVGQAVVLP